VADGQIPACLETRRLNLQPPCTHFKKATSGLPSSGQPQPNSDVVREPSRIADLSIRFAPEAPISLAEGNWARGSHPPAAIWIDRRRPFRPDDLRHRALSETVASIVQLGNSRGMRSALPGNAGA
jgi:hypothetical protein